MTNNLPNIGSTKVEWHPTPPQAKDVSQTGKTGAHTITQDPENDSIKESQCNCHEKMSITSSSEELPKLTGSSTEEIRQSPFAETEDIHQSPFAEPEPTKEAQAETVDKPMEDTLNKPESSRENKRARRRQAVNPSTDLHGKVKAQFSTTPNKTDTTAEVQQVRKWEAASPSSDLRGKAKAQVSDTPNKTDTTAEVQQKKLESVDTTTNKQDSAKGVRKRTVSLASNLPRLKTLKRKAQKLLGITESRGRKQSRSPQSVEGSGTNFRMSTISDQIRKKVEPFSKPAQSLRSRSYARGASNKTAQAKAEKVRKRAHAKAQEGEIQNTLNDSKLDKVKEYFEDKKNSGEIKFRQQVGISSYQDIITGETYDDALTQLKKISKGEKATPQTIERNLYTVNAAISAVEDQESVTPKTQAQPEATKPAQTETPKQSAPLNPAELKEKETKIKEELDQSRGLLEAVVEYQDLEAIKGSLSKQGEDELHSLGNQLENQLGDIGNLEKTKGELEEKISKLEAKL